MSAAKVFHVISFKLLIEQQGEHDVRIASELAQVAVDAAANLLQHVSGRDVQVKAMVIEPIRLIEPAHMNHSQGD